MPVPQTVIATAPGKLILMGEHAAVYGRPALVAAFGLETRASLVVGTAGAGGSGAAAVRLDLPDIGVVAETDWSSLREDAARYRLAWERFLADPSNRELERLRRGDPARVVKLALAESLDAGDTAPPPVELSVESELPVGSGFGSSASVAVAVAGALRRAIEGSCDLEAVARSALEVERREHGRPSGIDHGTVLFGGVQWMERSPSGELDRRTLADGAAALAGLAVFQTGGPAESTGEVVEAVRRRFASRGSQLEATLDAMEADVRALGEWLSAGDRGAPELLDPMRDFERRLEALGVVPEAVRDLVRRVEAAGGAAKISGAGALTGSAAGSLLVYHPERPPRTLSCLAALRPFEAALGVAGLRVESNG